MTHENLAAWLWLVIVVVLITIPAIAQGRWVWLLLAVPLASMGFFVNWYNRRRGVPPIGDRKP